MISLSRLIVIFSSFLLPDRDASILKIKSNISKVHTCADGANFVICILCKGGSKYFLYSVVSGFISVAHICRCSWWLSYILSYSSVRMGLVVSCVLKFAYLFSIIGFKLLKYPLISIVCDNIISSCLRLYATFINGNIFRSNIKTRMRLYRISSSESRAIYITSLLCIGLSRFFFGITILHRPSSSVSFTQYFVSLHFSGFLFRLVKQLVVTSPILSNTSSV